MKYFRYTWGVVLIALAVISFIAYMEDDKSAPVFHILNIIILLSYGIYFLFLNRKKNITISRDKLIVKKGQVLIKEYDLSTKERVVESYKSIKIIFKDFSEIFKYSDFNKESIQKFKSLVAKN